MSQKTYIKVSGTWREVTNIWRKSGGAWTDNKVVSWIKAGGSWQQAKYYAPPVDNTWEYSWGGQSIQSPWDSIYMADMDWDSGYFSIYALWSYSAFTHVYISANLYDADWNYLSGTGYFYDDAYAGYSDTISCSGYVGRDNMAAEGYKVVVTIYVSY